MLILYFKKFEENSQVHKKICGCDKFLCNFLNYHNFFAEVNLGNYGTYTSVIMNKI